MEVFTEELTSEGKAFLSKHYVYEDYGSALYMTQPLLFSQKEISCSKVFILQDFFPKYFINVQKSQNGSSGHVHSLLHSRAIIYSLLVTLETRLRWTD